MIAEIISVGTEVVTGDIIDTNAPYIAKELNLIGIETMYRSGVRDDEEIMTEVLEIAKSRADVIITIGGLGPTYDDITKEVVAKINELELVTSKEVENDIRDYFLRVGKTMTENNMRQAKIIKNSQVFKNSNGTAPGLVLEQDDKIFIMLPGPPNELIPMMDSQIKPFLLEKLSGFICEKTIKVFGIGESYVESLLYDLMTENKNPILAPYAKIGEVHLKITSRGETKEEAEKLMKPLIEKIYARLDKNIYGENDDTLASKAIELLRKKSMTVAFCESCTGGFIAKTLTDIPGASDVFGFGAVTYADQAKTKLVGVSPIALKNQGAVSEDVAIQMAKGIRGISNADIAISATGIAGPGGATEQKDVGLVYMGFVTKNTAMVKKFNLNGNRDKVRLMTVKNALSMIIEHLK